MGKAALISVKAVVRYGAIYRRRDRNSSKCAFRGYLASRQHYFHKSLATDDLKEAMLGATEVRADLRGKITK